MAAILLGDLAVLAGLVAVLALAASTLRSLSQRELGAGRATPPAPSLWMTGSTRLPLRGRSP